MGPFIYLSSLRYSSDSVSVIGSCPTRIRTLTDRTKTCSASHYTMGQILYYRQTPLSSFVSAKVERKNQTTKHFAEKLFAEPFYIGGVFCFRVPGRPRVEALSSETFIPWYTFEVEKTDPPQGWYIYIQRTHLLLACRSCVAPDRVIIMSQLCLRKLNVCSLQ